jgi:hypothetical protein
MRSSASLAIGARRRQRPHKKGRRATTINIDNLLTDPSFETSTSGCPTGWTSGGSPGIGDYAPTSK